VKVAGERREREKRKDWYDRGSAFVEDGEKRRRSEPRRRGRFGRMRSNKLAGVFVHLQKVKTFTSFVG